MNTAASGAQPAFPACFKAVRTTGTMSLAKAIYHPRPQLPRAPRGRDQAHVAGGTHTTHTFSHSCTNQLTSLLASSLVGGEFCYRGRECECVGGVPQGGALVKARCRWMMRH